MLFGHSFGNEESNPETNAQSRKLQRRKNTILSPKSAQVQCRINIAQCLAVSYSLAFSIYDHEYARQSLNKRQSIDTSLVIGRSIHKIGRQSNRRPEPRRNERSKKTVFFMHAHLTSLHSVQFLWKLVDCSRPQSFESMQEKINASILLY